MKGGSRQGIREFVVAPTEAAKIVAGNTEKTLEKGYKDAIHFLGF